MNQFRVCIWFCYFLLSLQGTGGLLETSAAEKLLGSGGPRKLEFRAIIGNYEDARPPKGKAVEEQVQAQAAKLAGVRGFIQRVSAEGFNAVVWMGPDEFWPGGQALLRLDEFPEAQELSVEDSEAAIAYMKQVFAAAKSVDLRNFLYASSVAWTPSFGKAHGLDRKLPVSATVHTTHNNMGPPYNCGVRNELTRRYTAAIYAEATKLYEDLDGFYAPMGEPLPGRRSTFFNEAIAPGLKRSGRMPLIIVHQWEIPLEEYWADIVKGGDYKLTWLGFHGWNAEQITDAKPYPSLVDWAQRTGLPTVASIIAGNVQVLPFNSPRFAYEMAREMKKVENFRGYVYWEHSSTGFSWLFRRALTHYSQSAERYSEERWRKLLEGRFGDGAAAGHFLKAFNISGTIMPELNALVYDGYGYYRKEYRLTYKLFTFNDEFKGNWMTSPVRPELVPVWYYAKKIAGNPGVYKDCNGSEISRGEPRQLPLWGLEGGSAYATLPPVHMKKIRAMGQECFEEAEAGLQTVQKNKAEAQRICNFMKLCQLMTRYFERKVAAATAALVYAQTRRAADKVEAERWADETLVSYKEAGNFILETLPELEGKCTTFWQGSKSMAELVADEVEERKNLQSIFGWPN